MSTCAFCDALLGANELLPEYPIGRRLAFDPSTARLWAVCPKCERWNLSFLDDPERRDAVRKLDDFLAATPHRSDANDLTFGEVGNTELVRVGPTGWRSFAAWRYGRKLHKKYRFWLMTWPLWIVLLVFLNSPAGQELLNQLWFAITVVAVIHVLGLYGQRKRRFTVPSEDGSPWLVGSAEINKIAVEVHGDRWTLLVPTHADHIRLEAFDALDALRKGLPLMAFRGGSRVTVDRAVKLILSVGGPARFLSTTFSSAGLGDGVHRLAGLGELVTIALEISVNEFTERSALNTDLTVARLAHTDASRIAEAIES